MTRSLRWLGLVDATPDWRSGLVATLTAISLAGAVVRFKGAAALVPPLTFILLLGAVVAIEVKTGVIPDVITLPGTVIGGILRTLVTSTPLLDTIAGVVVGGGGFFLVIVFNRGGLGGGVMKLGAMSGAFLGWKLAAVASFSSVICGGGAAMLMIARGRQPSQSFEFGPFLAAGSLFSLFWGERVLRWYVGQ